MPLFNRKFSSGKMNKDMDERIVMDGEYRDAVNIEVQSSNESDNGSAQNILGNTLISGGLVPDGSVCVGSIADHKNDKIYYLVAGPEPTDFDWNVEKCWKDYIIEYDITTETFKYVFVDIYRANFKVASVGSSTNTDVSGDIQLSSSSTNSFTEIRADMLVSGYISSQTPANYIKSNEKSDLTVLTYDDTYTSGVIRLYNTSQDLSTTTIYAGTYLNLSAKRILNFHKDRYITGMNIIDGMLFWTDNHTEPKKIKIERCIGGTGGSVPLPSSLLSPVFDGDNDLFHTRLCVTPDKDRPLAVKRRKWSEADQSGLPWYVEEENITVIRKGPLSCPTLIMSEFEEDRDGDTFSKTNGSPSLGISGPADPQGVESNSLSYTSTNMWAYTKKVGMRIINVYTENPVDWRLGDIIIFNQDQDDQLSPNGFTEHDVRAKVITGSTTSTPSTGPWNFLIESIDKESIDLENKKWNLRLEQVEPMFEFKFPRFAYRYKYEDGEYSTFSPWSEPAFIPGPFDYLPKKAYNLGMTNRLRSLKITNYVVEESLRPQDVVEIDLLYKDEASTNIYTVETIKMTDSWSNDTDDLYLWPDSVNGPRNQDSASSNYLEPLINVNENHRGEYVVTSELIHATVPSNQMLRQWDNVPRKALAQEISSNRLVYGNYLQNYNLTSSFIEGEVKPKILVQLEAGEADLNATDAVFNQDTNEYTVETNYDPDTGDFVADGVPTPHKTCRSLREYQIGVVYGDEYGRETPVLAGKSGSGTLNIPKEHSSTVNKIKAQIVTDHPSWAKYFKFFVKETSNEYYNMAMDRWYDAEDGNIWLSFPSADRNKVDEESFIILKKRHDTHQPVTDPAKYKVIAIENEAPEFIKTNVKKIGQAYESNPGVSGSAGIGSLGLGFPLKDFSEIWVRQNCLGLDKVFSGASNPFGSADSNSMSASRKSIYDHIQNGYFYLRARTAGTKSEWYQVTKLIGEGSFWKFTLDNPMKEDVDFCTTDGTFLGAVDDLRIEFAVHKVEHKKEFEGRFFIKIYKDLVLLQNLLLPAEKNWKPRIMGRISYWNWPEGKRRLGSSSEWYSSGLLCNGNFYELGSGNQTTQPDFAYGSTSGSAQDKKFFFQPANSSVPYDGLYGIVPIGCLSQQSVATWMSRSYGMLFIDRTHPRGCQASYEGSCNGWARGDQWGRGIHRDGMAMDIGYIHKGGYGSSSGSDGSAHTNVSSYSDWEEQHLFMKELMRKSSTFRFREDPDGIVYKVTGAFFGKKTWSNTHDEWGYWGEKSEPAGETGIGRYHTWHQYSSKNYGNNMTRVRIYFEQYENPGVGIGQGPSGYSPIGGKSTTKIKNTPELGYWGGRQIGTEYGAIADPYPIPDQNASSGFPFFLSWTVEANMGGGHTDSNMVVPMPPGYPVSTVSCGDSTVYTNVDGEELTGIQQARRWRQHTAKYHHIEIVENMSDNDQDWSSENPAIWETEPKEDVGMDIYYEASNAIPINITSSTNELFAPFDSIVNRDYSPYPQEIKIESWSDNIAKLDTSITYAGGSRFRFTSPDGFVSTAIVEAPLSTPTNILKVRGWDQQAYPIADAYHNDAVHNQFYTLSWFNAYCFGNGIESDRIRDDFNQSTLKNGVKASTVLAEQYKEDRKKAGLIHSGIYNSTSHVNSLNQFLAAEKITKDMNPSYGSIQKLHTRDNNIVVLHEDKCMKVLADKDALFNADGSQNVAISSKFLGTDQPFSTKYGISTNPESCAVDLHGRLYFSDRTRGAVLRLSNDGVTNIADYGMRNWFGDNLGPLTQKVLGSYDDKKREYNITIKGLYPVTTNANTSTSSSGNCGCVNGQNQITTQIGSSDDITGNFENTNVLITQDNFNIGDVQIGSNSFYNSEVTLSFSEQAKGWISFKSFIPESGVSINNEYYTFKGGEMYKHHSNPNHNVFYEPIFGNDAFTESSITLLFNDQPSDVKSFSTLNYEGSQAKISVNTTDNEYYNLEEQKGWYIDHIKTNLQETSLLEFKEKEGKWFTFIKGDTTTLQNLDEAEFSVQGVGSFDRMIVTGQEIVPTRCLTLTPVINCDPIQGCMDPSASNYNPNATVDDGSCLYEVDPSCPCDWVGKWEIDVKEDGRVEFDLDGTGYCKPFFVRALNTTSAWDGGGITYFTDGKPTNTPSYKHNPHYHANPPIMYTDPVNTTNPSQSGQMLLYPSYDTSSFPVSPGFYHMTQGFFNFYHDRSGIYYIEIIDQHGCVEILNYTVEGITFPTVSNIPCENGTVPEVYNATGPTHDASYFGNVYGSWAATIMSHPDFNLWYNTANPPSYVRIQDDHLDPNYDPTDSWAARPMTFQRVQRYLVVLQEGGVYPDRVVQAFNNAWINCTNYSWSATNLPFQYVDLGGGFWQVNNVNSDVSSALLNPGVVSSTWGGLPNSSCTTININLMQFASLLSILNNLKDDNGVNLFPNFVAGTDWWQTVKDLETALLAGQGQPFIYVTHSCCQNEFSSTNGKPNYVTRDCGYAGD